MLITEGASPELLDRWCPQLLPNFHRLRSEDAWGPMRSEFVPYEPSGLFSAFTGYRPAEHGCFSYWAVHSPDYQPVVLDGSVSQRPFIWHRGEFAEHTVAVVNVFGTHPVTSVNGYCLGYPMRATVHACHPRDLPVRLARKGIHPLHDVTIWFTGGDRDNFIGKVLHADRQRAAATFELIDGRLGDAPDLTILNLTSIDRLSHAYWQEVEPGSPVPEQDMAILRAYELADEVLGRLLDRVDEHTSVLAFSEIGFGPLRAYCSVNDALAAADLLVADSTGRPDWKQTKAFEAVQGSHGVNVNVEGRYKHGSVQPHDYQRAAAEVRAVLLEVVNPYTGMPLLTDVLQRDEVHIGAHADGAPDLILVPRDWRYLPLGDPLWSAKTNRHLQSGWHRGDSYWGGAGPAFSGVRRGTPGETIDVAPTITAMLGRGPIEDFHGTPLGGMQ